MTPVFVFVQVSFEVTFNGGVVSHQPVDSLNARSETMSGLPAGVYPLTVYAENNVSNDTQQVGQLLIEV